MKGLSYTKNFSSVHSDNKKLFAFISSDVIVTADVIPLYTGSTGRTGNETVWRDKNRQRRRAQPVKTRLYMSQTKQVLALPTPLHCKLTAFIFRLAPSHSVALSLSLCSPLHMHKLSHMHIYRINLGSQMWTFSLKQIEFKKLKSQRPEKTKQT